MELTPQGHIFDVADKLRIEGWGYVLLGGTSEIDLVTFMQRNYPNFDLTALLSEVERLFPPTTTLTIARKIDFDPDSGNLSLLLANAYFSETDALVFERLFSNTLEGISVEHLYCVIPAIHQQQGLIKRVFQASLRQYVNMGLRTIKVHAGLSAGGHVWARHGFVAVDPREVRRILDDARNRLTANDFEFVDEIYQRYYSRFPDGRQFPMILWAGFPFMKDILRGSDWHGEVDLQNIEQFRNFRDYVFRP